MVGSDKSLLAFGSASCPHLARFRDFCGVLSDTYGIILAPPEIHGTGLGVLSSLKSFCSGLIERRNHPWAVPLRRLGIRSRMSVAHSLFLFRKTLPSPSPDLNQFMDQISTPAPDADPEFLDFCTKKVEEIFRVGWDCNLYPNAALNSTVSVSSCAERSRMFGGCRSWVLDSQMPNISCREDFVESVLTVKEYQRPRPSKLTAIDTGGKWRKITVPSGNQSLLKPLHQSIYNHLSRFPWLLRGDAKASCFKDFNGEKGEIFVSGDYESATDFLNSHVSKHVLSKILQQCRSVPIGIQQMAMDSLSLSVILKNEGSPERIVEQVSGQMMGYLLSFPLLCLINFLTFKYAVPRKVPLRINGDDIVFRCTPEEKTKWFALVGASGLKLSVGKTMVSSRFFTLNSALFVSTNRGCSALPFIRSSALFPKSKDPEAVLGLRGRFNSFCPNYSGDRRSLLRVHWLKLNRSVIDVSRRSVTRGLGLCVSFAELVSSGQWAREAWYLSLEKEDPLPAPIGPYSCRPTGYKYICVPHITKEIRSAGEGVAAAFVDAAWNRPNNDIVNDWFAEMRNGTFDWGYWAESRSKNARKRARLLGLSVANARRFLRPSRKLYSSSSFKSIKHGVWVPENFRQNLSMESGSNRFEVPMAPRARSCSVYVNEELCQEVDERLLGVCLVELPRTDFAPIRRDFRVSSKGCHVRVYPGGRVGVAPPAVY